MPWSGVELAEVAPWGSDSTTGATAGVVCGDYIVAFTPNPFTPSGALLPAGSFVSLHVPTQTAKAYSGASTMPHHPGSAVAIGGYVYVRATESSGSNRDFRRIDPVTGAVTILNTTVATNSVHGVAAAGRAAYVYQGSSQLHAYTTSGTLSTATGGWSSAFGIAYNAGVIYVADSASRVYEVDATTLAALGDYPVTGTIPAGVGVVIGDRIHWKDTYGITYYDMVTRDWGTYGVSGVSLDSPLAYHGGWLYAVSSAGLSAFNPNTGARVDDTLPTSLTYPGAVLLSAGGYLWRPYGEPVS